MAKLPLANMFYICSLWVTTARGRAMDNRVNKIRKRISVLRLEMQATEGAMRGDVAHDLDCTGTATRLMALRAELVDLVGERRTLGDLTPIGLPDLRKPRFARR
jgi:hypothetical protein